MPASPTNTNLSHGQNRKLLNTAGLRSTSQRDLILEVIRRGQGHMDADEVHRQAQKKQPRLSLSTVYRTLQTLKKLGLIEELHFDESHHHYEIKPASTHHHLICLGCGKVVEFECPLSQKMKSSVSRDNDFEITDVEVQMKGYCSACRENKE